jgi:hypothetical protein
MQNNIFSRVRETRFYSHEFRIDRESRFYNDDECGMQRDKVFTIRNDIS